ncbi:single-stranded DNA-binding protein [Bacillus sp. B-jedd]|uniref:single-stranded DNA-binding protein n=1 Tax=Bacillus sp. B-jedd TaxID=1476857 RepID=UPI0005155947|nr:single-stranded DNA-binding protein [Bacillus sp. B-jedd]CEG29146.1 single-strand binding protein [Bacillus sp. B-jedd]
MINQVTLVGRLTKDPELKKTTEGHCVSNVILAVNRSFRNNHGEIDTDFVQCTLWKKAAENTVQYCRKGSVVGITGRIQTRHYDNQDGKRIYVTEVVAESIRFLSSRPADGERRAADQQRMEPAPAQEPFPFYTPEHAHHPYENPNPHPEAPQPPPQHQPSHQVQPPQQAPAHAFSFERTETIQPAKEELPIGSL